MVKREGNADSAGEAEKPASLAKILSKYYAREIEQAIFAHLRKVKRIHDEASKYFSGEGKG